MIEFIIILAVCGIILAFYLGYKLTDLKSENEIHKKREKINKVIRETDKKIKRGDKSNFYNNVDIDN